jgi:hypothetical protein
MGIKRIIGNLLCHVIVENSGLEISNSTTAPFYEWRIGTSTIEFQICSSIFSASSDLPLYYFLVAV